MASAKDSQMPVALIVDDDADIRHLLERVLMQSGFETILTANAVDGVAAVAEFDPVITMLDVSMPGMDGFAAARRIREFSGTYIIMLTALADEIDVIQGLGAGADDYLLKPFRPRELRARIETLLRRPRDRFELPRLQAPTGVMPNPVGSPLWTADKGKDDAPRNRTNGNGHERSEAVPTKPVGAAARKPEPVAVAAQASVTATKVEPDPDTEQVETIEPQQEGPKIRVDVDGNQVVEKPVVHQLSAVLPVDEWLTHQGLSINTATGACTADGRSIELSATEFALLATLIESGRRVRSTANLVLTLRGESYVTTYYVNEADKSAVKAHMTNLRRKLGDTNPTPRWIESVRGVGYRMTSD